MTYLILSLLKLFDVKAYNLFILQIQLLIAMKLSFGSNDKFYRLIFQYDIRPSKEDILITKNGKIVAKLTNPNQNKVNMAKSLFGILPEDASLDDAKAERLNAK